MKVYVDANDIGKTVTYKEENGKRQYLYVHDKEGFIFKDLSDHDKQVRKEVCEEIRRMSAIDIVNKQYIIETEILDQIQGVEDGKINN